MSGIRSLLIGTPPFLLQNPSYVTIANSLGHDVNESHTSNLFKLSFNFLIPAAEYVRSLQTIMLPRPMNLATGPRIFLDRDDFGLALNDVLLDEAVNR